jgi:hypothetical protein
VVCAVDAVWRVTRVFRSVLIYCNLLPLNSFLLLFTANQMRHLLVSGFKQTQNVTAVTARTIVALHYVTRCWKSIICAFQNRYNFFFLP